MPLRPVQPKRTAAQCVLLARDAFITLNKPAGALAAADESTPMAQHQTLTGDLIAAGLITDKTTGFARNIPLGVSGAANVVNRPHLQNFVQFLRKKTGQNYRPSILEEHWWLVASQTNAPSADASSFDWFSKASSRSSGVREYEGAAVSAMISSTSLYHIARIDDAIERAHFQIAAQMQRMLEAAGEELHRPVARHPTDIPFHVHKLKRGNKARLRQLADELLGGLKSPLRQAVFEATTHTSVSTAEGTSAWIEAAIEACQGDRAVHSHTLQRTRTWLGSSGLSPGTSGQHGRIGPKGTPEEGRVLAPNSDALQAGEASLGAYLAATLQQEAADVVNTSGGPWPLQLQAMANECDIDLGLALEQLRGPSLPPPIAGPESETTLDSSRRHLHHAIRLCAHAGFSPAEMQARVTNEEWADGSKIFPGNKGFSGMPTCPKLPVLPPGCSLILPLLPRQFDPIASGDECADVRGAGAGSGGDRRRGSPMDEVALAAVHSSIVQRAIAPVLAGVHAAAAGVPPAGPSPFVFPGLESVEAAAEKADTVSLASRDADTGEPLDGSDAALRVGLGASRCMMHAGLVRVAAPSRAAQWVSKAVGVELRARQRAGLESGHSSGADRVDGSTSDSGSASDMEVDLESDRPAEGQSGSGGGHRDPLGVAAAAIRSAHTGIVRAQVAAPAPMDMLWYCQRALGLSASSVQGSLAPLAWFEGLLWGGRLPLQDVAVGRIKGGRRGKGTGRGRYGRPQSEAASQVSKAPDADDAKAEVAPPSSPTSPSGSSGVSSMQQSWQGEKSGRQ